MTVAPPIASVPAPKLLDASPGLARDVAGWLSESNRMPATQRGFEPAEVEREVELLRTSTTSQRLNAPHAQRWVHLCLLRHTDSELQEARTHRLPKRPFLAIPPRATVGAA